MKDRVLISEFHDDAVELTSENRDQAEAIAARDEGDTCSCDYGLDCDIRQRNTIKRYPELDAYGDDRRADLSRKPDNVPEDELGLYEIIFEVGRCRYYCFVNAINMNEALGQFFRAHPNMTYNNIIEHLEV